MELCLTKLKRLQSIKTFQNRNVIFTWYPGNCESVLLTPMSSHPDANVLSHLPVKRKRIFKCTNIEKLVVFIPDCVCAVQTAFGFEHVVQFMSANKHTLYVIWKRAPSCWSKLSVTIYGIFRNIFHVGLSFCFILDSLLG